MISFEEGAVARLRDRLGKAETARADLLAFARGHSGAVASIHQAVLRALEAASLDELLGIITGEWPDILGLDSVVLALVVGDQAFRADRAGVQLIARPIVDRARSRSARSNCAMWTWASMSEARRKASGRKRW